MTVKELELKDLPDNKMVVQYVFDEANTPVGGIIKHYNVDVDSDTARVLRVGVITSVDRYFINYCAYSPEDDEMKDYSIHYTDVYIPGINVVENGKFMSAYEVVSV